MFANRADGSGRVSRVPYCKKTAGHELYLPHCSMSKRVRGIVQVYLV